MAKLKNKSTALRVRRPVSDVPVELPDADAGAVRNEYYIAVSRRYKLSRLITLALFMIYVLIMLATHSEDITIANLQYLIRDINKSADEAGAFSGVSYSAEPIQRFDIHRGELAYVTGRQISLISATGGVGLTSELSYENPALDSGEKYLMLYDIGGTSFSIYNSFSELYSGETEFTIISGDMSESGSFVLVAESRERRATVYLYDANFELRSKYSKSEYVSDAALSDDGTRLAMTEFGASDGSFYTDLCVYEPGVDEPVNESRIAGEYPLSVECVPNGFCVMTTAGVYYYTSDGEPTGSYAFGGGVGLANVDKLGGRIAYTMPENALGTENRVVILDAGGTVCYNAIIEEKVTDISILGAQLAILTPSHAVLIDAETGAQVSRLISASAKRLIATGSGTALLCTSSSAKTIDFTGAPAPDGEE